MKRELARSSSITDAIHGAGYSSSSRFYETAQARLGMTARARRAGAPGESIRCAVATCSLGLILVAATARGVCSIAFGDDAAELRQALAQRFPKALLIEDDPVFATMVADVLALVERPGLGHALPVDVRGTAFQERVWRALQAIPPGTTASYGEIATAMGARRASRAVAQACAANPLAVAIPCHRVVRGDGDISGYRWGRERKTALLARESGAA
jgi:AraC family transcriptional regulator of adaptative response/methylated-DNA-[protein]-cysteine methyltransferase